MKRINNIYDRLLDIDYIIEIYNIIKKRIKNKKKIEKFEEYFSLNILDIKNRIINKKMDKYNMFIIRYPKERLILSLNLKDKIVNHMVAYQLINILDNSLVDSNVAVRCNRGNSYALKLIKRYLNSIDDYYVLKCDIKKYFYNIDHNILKKLIRKKIKDKQFLEIVDYIIDSTNSEYIINYCRNNNINYLKFNKGLGIGNMTSQILAIYYLNDLDHYIKEVLKIKYYIRYMDDIVLIYNNKLYLKECLDKIKIFLDKYKLELNNKTCISHNNFIFIGYHFINKDIRIISKNRRKIKKKLRILKRYNYNKYILVNNSYKGYFRV